MSSSWLDQSSNANCFKQTYIQGFLDICGNVIIRNNGNLTVGGNANVSGSVTCGNNIQPYYKYLFQTSDIKQNYNIVQIIPTSGFLTTESTGTSINNNNGNLSFKNGVYKASSSSNSSIAYKAFNGSVDTEYNWKSDSSYNGGIYNGIYNTNSISGDWIQIELPTTKNIALKSFSICCLTPDNAPNEFYLFGSSSTNILTTTWNQLYTNSASLSNPFSSNTLQTYTIKTDNNSFLNFRLVIKSIYNANLLQPVIINQLNLYGIPYNTDIIGDIYSNNFWFNYGSSTYDLLDSSSVSISTATGNTVSGLGNSLYINNLNYLSLPTINLSNTNSFSILFWIKINNNQSTIYEFNSLSNSIKLVYDNAILILSITTGSTTNSQSIALNISNWCHIGIIHFTSSVNIYINGIIFQTITGVSYTPDNYVINYIGRSKSSNSPHNSNFYMSDFRTYLFSLNAFQINSIYKVTDILTVNNSLSYHFKDTYFGSNVNIYNDLSLNGNINIISGNIFTVASTANIFTTTTNTGIINIGTNSENIFVGASAGKTTIRNDVSMNGNLWINRDLSLNGNFNITSGNILTGASTANIFTTTTNTGIINIGTNSENIFVGASAGKTTIRNDVSMNGNLWINRDLSLNGNFNISSGNILTGASTANIFTTNAGIINIGTTSSNIFVGASAGKTTIRNDVSMNGNLWINRDLSLNGNFNISSGNILTGASTANIFTTTTNTGIINIGTNSENIFVGASAGKTTIRNDVSMNGNLWINRDLSLNGNFNITSGNILTGASTANIFTTTMNTGIINIGTNSENIFVGASSGKTTIRNDVSMNGNLWINRDLSLNGNFNITSGNILTGASTANIFTTNAGIINIGTISSNIFVGASAGKTTIRNDVSMNGNVSIIGDVSMNNNLYLKGNCNINTNCNITGNCSIIGKIYTNTINARLLTDTILFNNNINTNGKNIDCSGGNITAVTINAITFNATSDYRIKDDIKQITYNVDKLKPVQYINKESKKEDIGLIAHELQEICPFLVTGEKDGNEYQSVNYIGIIGILIKEIQDLKKRVDIIEKKG